MHHLKVHIDDGIISPENAIPLSHWKQVIDLCDSAKYFEKAVEVAWGE